MPTRFSITSVTIQQATSLIGAVWVDVTSQVANVNGLIDANVTNPPSPSFFRTVTP